MKKSKSKNAEKTGVVKSNLVNKLTLEVLNDKHNALARYLGAPCVVDVNDVHDYAVMSDGGLALSKGFVSYRVDLEPFKGQFDKIYFRAATNGKDVAFGMLLDSDGNVEVVANNDKPAKGYIKMTLTANSNTLIASMPAKNSKPLWKDVKVELLNDSSVIANMNNALNTLLGKIEALEERLNECNERNVAGVNIW